MRMARISVLHAAMILYHVHFLPRSTRSFLLIDTPGLVNLTRLSAQASKKYLPVARSCGQYCFHGHQTNFNLCTAVGV